MTGIGCLIYRKHKLLNKRLQYFFLRVLIWLKKGCLADAHMLCRLCRQIFLDFEQTLRLKLITVTQREKVYGILNRSSCQKTGLSVHTLRYYEKEGLLPFVRKNSSGLRVFSDSDLGWLELIECLKATGLHLKGIKQYIDWYIEGDSTLQLRLDMFRQQKIRIEEQMVELQKHMNKINYKIELYTKAVAAGTLHPEKKSA